MAQIHSLSWLIAAMDGLWFHQIIPFSNPISLPSPTTLRIPPQTTSSDSVSHSSPNLTAPPPHPEEETSAPQSVVDEKDDPKNEGEDKELMKQKKERPTRLNLMRGLARSFSSSPAAKKLAKNVKHLGAVKSLPKTMSCKSLWELELEEVKGFMDLGFKFKRQHLSPRMITMIPGLQRLGGIKNIGQKTEPSDSSTQSANCEDDEIEEVEEEEEKVIVRPYLSEAWLIKRPDSPLLNLKIPRVSASADMKKHLWHWARTVAFVIQQES